MKFKKAKQQDADSMIISSGLNYKEMENILTDLKTDKLTIPEAVDKLRNHFETTAQFKHCEASINLVNIAALNHQQFVECVIEQHEDMQNLVKAIRDKK